MTTPQIMILGIGNILLTDEGFGVHTLKKLHYRYNFSENVTLVDGGVLGMNLLGVIGDTDELIVIDVVRNHHEPGTLYRLDHEDIPNRMRAKNSLHQVDFLETMTLLRHGLDKEPHTVIFGIEPEDITTYAVEMTPRIQARIDDIIEKVLEEVVRLGGSYTEKGMEEKNVSCYPF